jgi:hypothetical protein
MVIRFRFGVAATLAILGACRTAGPVPAIEPELASRVPLGSTALAFLDLDQLRASPLAARLPANVSALLEPFRNSHRVLIAARGGELLAIARGVVPGAALVSPGVSLLGAPGLIAAATVPHLPAALLATAEPVARGHAIWIAAQGGIALPLEGNLANVNTLLRDTETVTMILDLPDPGTGALRVQLAAHCGSPNAALHFEQTVRAIVSLTAATTRRQPAMAGFWNAIQLTRDGRVVRVTASINADAVAQLLR